MFHMCVSSDYKALTVGKSADCTIPFKRSRYSNRAVRNSITESRHTIVCRAAQEAGAPHREYISRKKGNAIFTPM